MIKATGAHLTVAQLEAYEARLRDSGLSIVDLLRPGLDDAGLDSRSGQAGIRLSSEARLWFRWHDGAEHDRFDVEIAPGFVFLTLERAIAERARLLELTAKPEDPDLARWRAEWLPLLRSYATVACDCSVPEGAASPILAVDPPMDPDGWWKPKAASLGDMVDLWIRAWDTGAWKADLDRDIVEVKRQQPLPDGSRNPLLDI